MINITIKNYLTYNLPNNKGGHMIQGSQHNAAEVPEKRLMTLYQMIHTQYV